MLWFNFILDLNFIFLCFKLVIIHYLTQRQNKIKFKPRTKLNHNVYKDLCRPFSIGADVIFKHQRAYSLTIFA